ncbi:MAG: HAD family hydrolase [Rickettsiales bacterium]
MMKLPKPRAILFDWDNTLVNTWPLIHSALNMTLRHMGHPEWTYDRVKLEVKQSMRDSFPAMFGDRWEEAAKHYQKSYRAVHLEQLTPLPDAEAMLRSISRPGVFTGIVSNKQGPTLRLELEQLGWQEYFCAAIGASDAARDKPHPDPVLLALSNGSIGAGPDVWFVGDTGVDLEVAQATGCTAVLYGEHYFDGSLKGQYDGFAFMVNVHNHAELKALIEANQ